MIIILGLIILAAAVIVAVVAVLGNSGTAHPLNATIDQARLAFGPSGLTGIGAGMPGDRADR